MSNYTRGRAKEYRVMEILRRRGYTVTRSASSKGLWDVAAVNPEEVLLIQVKGTKRKSMDENLKQFKHLEVPGGVRKQLWWLKPGTSVVEIVDLEVQ